MDSLVADDSSKILTDTSYIKFLRDSIGGKGMYETIAQTRISASYGLMQLTYYGAVDAFIDSWGLEYPNNDAQYLPEYIMIPNMNIEYASKHFLGRLREVLPGSIVYPNEDTWPKEYGFELSIWKALLKYNGGSVLSYPNSVFNYAKNNLPKKKLRRGRRNENNNFINSIYSFSKQPNSYFTAQETLKRNNCKRRN